MIVSFASFVASRSPPWDALSLIKAPIGFWNSQMLIEPQAIVRPRNVRMILALKVMGLRERLP